MSILIQNGTLLCPEGPVKADLRVEDGKIAQLGPALPAGDSQVLDAAGKLVFPGFIDTHTHFEMNKGLPNETADDWASGTRAAVAGGTTCVLDFAEPVKGASLASAAEEWHRRADGRSSCHYGFHMTIKDWDLRIREELPAMTAAGITSYKVYLAYDNLRVSNTELIAQGAANLVTPLFGGIPATGAIARTMTNINNGGRTPVAGIVHAVVLLLILLFLMPLAQYIPMACLAGVLIVVSYNMSGWRTFRALLSNPRADVTVLLLTFSLTVLFDLTVAIEVGLLIACVLFMKRVMETTEISVIRDEIDPGSGLDVAVHEEHLTVPRGVEVYEINGPYFFGIATKFEELMAQLGDRPKVRVIRMRKVPFIDSTGIHNLTNLCVMSRREKIEVVLSGVNDTVHAALQRSGFYELLGPDHICPNINAALERARRILGE